MRLLIFADPHWSSYSSIVRSRGDRYSTRLENLIQTMNWIEAVAIQHDCGAVVCLGDYFDKSDITAEETTALQEVAWNGLPHWFIVGNHETGRSNLEHSSSHLFQLLSNSKVIDAPYVEYTRDTAIVALPYILESHRKPLKEYLKDIVTKENLIILSHNDISGIQMGSFISNSGFTVEEIEQSCNLFINGHLHNGAEIGKHIINLGNITGQNFSEDAFHYTHCAMILDTANKSLVKIENPYALNFYKLEFKSRDKIIPTLNALKSNAVVTLKVNENDADYTREVLQHYSNIIESRLLVERNRNEVTSEEASAKLSLNHIEKFQSYVLNKLGNSNLILEELERVSR